jgi:arsenite-transporting ATPase
MRVLVFTGKGGTGKTTVAAATACVAASSGMSTLVVSTDPAHSLGDAFGARIGDQPTELDRNLWARQVDPVSRMERDWGLLRDEISALLDWAGASSLEAEEMAILPGVDEIFALLDLVEYDDEGRYDLIVIDAAPTAETLRLLALPEVARWWMSYVWPVGRGLAKIVRPVVGRISSMPIASEEALDAAEGLFDKLMRAHAILSDPDRSSIRLVFNPEKVVLAETKRTYTYLCLFGYCVDAVVANKVLGAGERDWRAQGSSSVEENFAESLVSAWIRRQSVWLTQAEMDFKGLAMLYSPYFFEEPVGLEALRRLGEQIYREVSPCEKLAAREPLSITENGDGALLQLYLPLASKENVSVMRKGRELYVRVDNQTRNVHLPHSLARRKVKSARYRDSTLSLLFED